MAEIYTISNDSAHFVIDRGKWIFAAEEYKVVDYAVAPTQRRLQFWPFSGLWRGMVFDRGVELFGLGLGNLYYASNDMDPYLKDHEDDDSKEEEDIIIKPDDVVIVCARNEDDVSHLEVWILEDPTNANSNMYVHHDIIIPAFSLCTAWLDCPVKGGDKGNFIAVGSMEPAIEIWDLDIMDEVQPSATLCDIIEKKNKGNKIECIEEGRRRRPMYLLEEPD